MTYLDSSIVIEVLDPGGSLYAQIAPDLLSLLPWEVAISEIVRLESLVQPTREGDFSRIALVEGFLSRFVSLPLDRNVYDLAIRLRADRKGLKTPDALHLATALRHGCAEFWTNDLDLAKVPNGLTFRTF